MGILFVSRKKYDIVKNNYKKVQEHRKELQRRNIELQKLIIKLENQVKEAEEDKLEVQYQMEQFMEKEKTQRLVRCIKCEKYFTTPLKSKRMICLDCKPKKKEEK